MEIFGKAVFAFYTVFRHLYLLVEVDLAAVRLVGNTDHIRSVGQQFQILGEFLNSGQVHAATGSALQFLPRDVFVISGAMGNKLDPSSNHGTSDKMGIDATIPVDADRARYEKIRISAAGWMAERKNCR